MGAQVSHGKTASSELLYPVFLSRLHRAQGISITINVAAILKVMFEARLESFFEQLFQLLENNTFT